MNRWWLFVPLGIFALFVGLAAYQLTRRRTYAEVAEGIIAGLSRHLGLKGGGFAATDEHL